VEGENEANRLAKLIFFKKTLLPSQCVGSKKPKRFANANQRGNVETPLNKRLKMTMTLSIDCYTCCIYIPDYKLPIILTFHIISYGGKHQLASF
jgi:hypothetical protein